MAAPLAQALRAQHPIASPLPFGPDPVPSAAVPGNASILRASPAATRAYRGLGEIPQRSPAPATAAPSGRDAPGRRVPGPTATATRARTEAPRCRGTPRYFGHPPPPGRRTAAWAKYRSVPPHRRPPHPPGGTHPGAGSQGPQRPRRAPEPRRRGAGERLDTSGIPRRQAGVPRHGRNIAAFPRTGDRRTLRAGRTRRVPGPRAHSDRDARPCRGAAVPGNASILRASPAATRAYRGHAEMPTRWPSRPAQRTRLRQGAIPGLRIREGLHSLEM